MNRAQTVLIGVLALLLVVGTANYLSGNGFVIVENTEPVTYSVPQLSVVATAADGSAVNWQREDTVVSGTVHFTATVTNPTENLYPITSMALEVYDTDQYHEPSNLKATIYFRATQDQLIYEADWDTTVLPDGEYALMVKMTLGDDPTGAPPPDRTVTPFSILFTMNDEGVSPVVVDTIPVWAMLVAVMLVAAVIYVIKRG